MYNEIHRLLIQKAQNNINTINNQKIIFQEKQNSIQDKLIELESLINEQVVSNRADSRVEKYLEKELLLVEKEQKDIKTMLDAITEQGEYLEKLVDKIQNLKSGSIALLNQVTTISKMRLLDPINKYSLLTDVTLPAETLDIIDNALKNIL